MTAGTRWTATRLVRGFDRLHAVLPLAQVNRTENTGMPVNNSWSAARVCGGVRGCGFAPRTTAGAGSPWPAPTPRRQVLPATVRRATFTTRAARLRRSRDG